MVERGWRKALVIPVRHTGRMLSRRHWLVLPLAAAGCGGKRNAQQSRPAAPVNRRVAIPSGAEIVLRTVDRIETDAASDAGAWHAVVSRDLRDEEGNLLLGSGSPARLGVAGAAGSLGLVLRGVMVNGNFYMIEGGGAPLTLLPNAIARVDPWGPAASSGPVAAAGEKISVPGQALLVFRVEKGFALE